MDLSAFTISCVFYLRDSYHFGIIAQHKLLGGMRMNVDLRLHVLFLFQPQFYLIFLLTNDGRWTLVYIREAESDQGRDQREQREQRDHPHLQAETNTKINKELKYNTEFRLIIIQVKDWRLYRLLWTTGQPHKKKWTTLDARSESLIQSSYIEPTTSGRKSGACLNHYHVMTNCYL